MSSKEMYLMDSKNIFISNMGNPKDFMMVRKISNNTIAIRSSSSLIVVDKNELLGVLTREDL